MHPPDDARPARLRRVVQPVRLALLIQVTALIAVGGCNRAPPLPPPPPVSLPTASTTAPTTAAPMMPTTAAPTPATGTATATPTPSPDPSVALSADAVICAAALHCCESTNRAARTAARREGIDPRYDPRRDSRYDDSGYDDSGYDDSGYDDPRIRRAVSRLASGCRELRDPDAAHASRCAQQIESIRRAFREVGARVPSTCRVPDLPAAMPAQRTDR